MLELDFPISTDIVDVLMEAARYDAVCDAYPLTKHMRRRLEEQGDLRWVQAVAARESLNWSGDDIVQALQHNKPPARFKKSGPVVRAIAKLAEDVRQLGGYPRASGAGALEEFRKRLDDVGRGFRGGLRDIWFVGGVKEIVEKDKIGEYVEALVDWFEHTPTGHSSVPGVAILHQELMHLCPYQQRSIGSIDALTRCVRWTPGALPACAGRFPGAPFRTGRAPFVMHPALHDGQRREVGGPMPVGMDQLACGRRQTA